MEAPKDKPNTLTITRRIYGGYVVSEGDDDLFACSMLDEALEWVGKAMQGTPRMSDDWYRKNLGKLNVQD
jgi:hypothetical protein